MSLKGVPQLRRRMRAVLTGVIPAKAEKAVHAALIQGGTVANSHAPVEYGFLRGSSYRRIQLRGASVYGAVGYTAKYAAWVHDAKGKLRGKPRASGRGNYWDPDAKPGFLADAFESPQNRREIDAVVYKVMKL